MRKLIISLTILTAIITFFILGCKKADKDEGEVAIIGSTTVLPVMQKIAEVYMEKQPEVNITVSGGGSSVGITSFIDGACEIAMSSRQMKDEEWAKVKEKNMDVKEVEIAKDGIAIVLHPSNSIGELTIAQVHDIYVGKIKNWKELWGPDLEIVCVSRDSASGTFEIFNKVVLQNDPLRSDALLQASNAAVRSAVAGAEGGIGYIGVGYITDEVKALTIDGVDPSLETVLSGKYPISRGLFLYILEGGPEYVHDIVDFVLSAEGQKIVEEVGYIPLK